MQAYNAVGWFELYVADIERARAFYTALFGRELSPLPVVGQLEAIYVFSWQEGVQGAPGALVKMAGKDPGPGGTLVYFSCRDVAEESARAGAAGGRVVMPKMAIGEHGFIALVEDTEGNVIGLHSMQ